MSGYLLAALAATCMFLLAGCRLTGKGEQKAEAAPAAKPRNPMEIVVSPDLMKQIRVGEIGFSSVSEILGMPARVEADETRIARVSAPVTARIIELDAVEGQEVRRGQVLATLHSTELSDSQFAFVKAYSQQTLAQRAAARAKHLLDADVIGSAELQRRETELLQASADLTRERDQLRVLGMHEEDIVKLEATRSVNSRSQLVATFDGTILERHATLGQVVQPAEIVFLVADLSQVWMVADVPEQASGGLAVGKLVEAEVPALPGATIRGKLTFVSATVNPNTRTVRIRIDLPNPGRRYKPAMLATMKIQGAAERRKVVPSTAIVREANDELIFVQKGPETFELRPVKLGGEHETNRVLESGVDPSERIVLDGAFHLNNERKRLALQGQ